MGTMGGDSLLNPVTALMVVSTVAFVLAIMLVMVLCAVSSRADRMLERYRKEKRDEDSVG